MEYNLKITFGGKTYFAEMDPGNSSEVFTKEKLVESSQFSDWTDEPDSEVTSSLSGDDLKWWTTDIHNLFKDTLSVRIEYFKLEI